MYEGKEGTVEETFPVKHQGSVYCVAFSEDGTKLITGGRGQGAKVWKVGAARTPLKVRQRWVKMWPTCSWASSGVTVKLYRCRCQVT